MAKRSDLLQNRLWKQGGEQQGRSVCVQTIVYQEQLGNSLKDLPKGVRWQCLFGHIIRAVGGKKYLVRFDNGEEKKCSLNILKVEHITASLSTDIPIT
jgi:hypothetical protein